MNKQNNATLIQELLDQYFPHPKIPLKHSDPFTLLIAVLLSAQCTDRRVNQITPKLFAKASTPEAMASLPVRAIEEIIRPCGLNKTKARYIKTLSTKIVNTYLGQVPITLKKLESLPGVGHKTASVVLIHAFNTPAFPVDTHIHRCAKRWGLSSGKSVTQTEKDLKKIFPKKLWEKLHLQIIHYARKYCPARGHKIERCPICKKLKEV